MKYLVQIGADVNAIDTAYSGLTPLMEACRAGHQKVCSLLIAHGARLELQDAQGNTALHWCARKGYVLSTTIILNDIIATKYVTLVPHLSIRRRVAMPAALAREAERWDQGSTKGKFLVCARKLSEHCTNSGNVLHSARLDEHHQRQREDTA